MGKMAPAPIVTGISPKEGPPGTRVTVRGENFGNGPKDLIGMLISHVTILVINALKKYIHT
jgi:exocyst complex component 2